MALVGKVPLRIANRPAVTVTDFNYDFDIPTTVKKGGYGPIGTAQGVGSGTFSFKMALRQENGTEFPLAVLLQEGLPIAFPLGPQRFALVGCVVNKHALAVQQAEGNTDFNVSGTFTDFKQSK